MVPDASSNNTSLDTGGNLKIDGKETSFLGWRNSLSMWWSGMSLSSSSTPESEPFPNATASLQQTSQEQQQEKEQHEKCTRRVENLVQNEPVVQFMLQELVRAGCPFDLSHIHCRPCLDTISTTSSTAITSPDGIPLTTTKPSSRSGGFSPGQGVILCQDVITSKTHLQDTLVHELIHAFDHCTAQVAWSSCLPYACSEIRAVSLSGECRFTREFQRGQVWGGIQQHHQTCVQRRATLGVQQVPGCGGRVGEEAVKQAWAACFADTAPFDRIY